MLLWIITPDFPPDIGGISDYAFQLSRELAASDRVEVVSGGGGGLPDNQVPIICKFVRSRPSTLTKVIKLANEIRPDWIIWQYNPFSFGGLYGLSPQLIHALGSLRLSGIRQAMVIHEIDLPGTSLKRRLLSIALRSQIILLGLSSMIIFVTVEYWKRQIARLAPWAQIYTTPVGSTIDKSDITRSEARRSLGIQPDQTVLGVFGRLDSTREIDFIKLSYLRVAARGLSPLLYYFGSDVQKAKWLFADLHHRAEGPLLANDVSERMSSLDIYLAAYSEGISARRTSLMVALRHAIPTVATAGDVTEAVFVKEDGRAILLAPAADPLDFALKVEDLATRESHARQAVGIAGQRLYCESFDWAVIARDLRAKLDQYTK